jgi:hypothetical protein
MPRLSYPVLIFGNRFNEQAAIANTELLGYGVNAVCIDDTNFGGSVEWKLII